MWCGVVWSWFGQEADLANLRNNSLYMRFTRRGRLITPDQVVDVERAAVLVYLSGFALAELDSYISGLQDGWADSVRSKAEEFRVRFLSA